MKNSLEELARQEQREYFKQWRAKNPDKVRRNTRNYWKRRAERRLQEQKKEVV